MRFQYLKSFFFILPLALGFVGISADASDFQSPRTAALGGAGHAGPMLNDAMYLNPSFGSFLPTYSLSANYLFFRGGQKEADGSDAVHGKLVNLSIQDGRSQLFQAGVGLSLKDNGKLVNLGASKAILSQFGIGLGGKFFFANDGAGPNARDMTLSTTYIATQWLHFSFMVDNLFATDADKQQGFHREYILGSKVNVKGIVLIYIDPHYAPDIRNEPAFGYENGIELVAFKDLFLRLGMFRNANMPQIDNLRGRGYGMGFGWIAPRLSIDYALSRLTQPQSVTNHVLGVTVYF